MSPSVSIGSFLVQEWAFTIDFTQVPNTSGVIVGIGNFGHGTPSLPGYRLAAFDTLGLAMPLTALVQIGSYDHTWTAFGLKFNDDVTLNTGSGDFVVTAVAGQNENNTDILLMSLPGGVQRLVVSTVGPTGGDTINVLIATASVLAGDYNDNGLWMRPTTWCGARAVRCKTKSIHRVLSTRPITLLGVPASAIQAVARRQ